MNQVTDTLDLGCGGNKTAGALGVDKDPSCGPDLVYDLDLMPWPWPDNRFRRIVARHLIEHVADLSGFMAEAWRVAAPGARIEIVAPHFSNPMAFADPTHRRALSARFIEFFCDMPRRSALTAGARAAAHLAFESEFDLKPFNSPVRFRILRRRVTFPRVWRLLGIAWLANKLLSFYEFYISGLIRARDIELDLEVVKEAGR